MEVFCEYNFLEKIWKFLTICLKVTYCSLLLISCNLVILYRVVSNLENLEKSWNIFFLFTPQKKLNGF